MRRIAWYAAAALMLSAGSASASFIAALQGPGGTDTVTINPMFDNVLDVAVYLSRDLGDGGTGISGAQLDFTAVSGEAFTVELVGVLGGSAGNAGTGTRYNDPEWESDVGGGLALDPDAAAGPLTSTPRGPIGTDYNGLWTTTSSLLGYVHLNIPASWVEGDILITPVNVLAFPDFVTQTDDVIGVGIPLRIVRIVPEPAIGLLLVVGLALLRRRR